MNLCILILRLKFGSLKDFHGNEKLRKLGRETNEQNKGWRSKIMKISECDSKKDGGQKTQRIVLVGIPVRNRNHLAEAIFSELT